MEMLRDIKSMTLAELKEAFSGAGLPAHTRLLQFSCCMAICRALPMRPLTRACAVMIRCAPCLHPATRFSARISIIALWFLSYVPIQGRLCAAILIT